MAIFRTDIGLVPSTFILVPQQVVIKDLDRIGLQEISTVAQVAVSPNLEVLFVGVLITRALLFEG